MVRAVPLQLMPGRRPTEAALRCFQLQTPLDIRCRLLWHGAVRWGQLACREVATARTGGQHTRYIGMYFLYVICICGTGDNLYIPLPEGTVIPLPEGTVKIILENPAPLLAGPDRGWSLTQL